MSKLSIGIVAAALLALTSGTAQASDGWYYTPPTSWYYPPPAQWYGTPGFSNCCPPVCLKTFSPLTCPVPQVCLSPLPPIPYPCFQMAPLSPLAPVCPPYPNWCR